MEKLRSNSLRLTEGQSAVHSLMGHMAYGAAELAKPIIQKGINLKSMIDKKELVSYKQGILKELREFPVKDSSFRLMVPVFVAVAEANPEDTLQQTLKFFPAMPEENWLDEISTMFTFLPNPSQDEQLLDIVVFFSEATFTFLVDLIIERTKNGLPYDLFDMLMRRVFVKIKKNPDPGSLEFKMCVMMVKRYVSIIRFLCKTDFMRFCGGISREFPTGKEHVIQGVVYATIMSFVEVKGDSDVFLNYIRIFDVFGRNHEVLVAAVKSMCAILPQIAFCENTYVRKLEKRVEVWFRIREIRKKVMPLLGVIHSYTLSSRKHDKFLERHVYKRLAKVKKMKHAIVYMNAVLAPNDRTFRWGVEQAPYVREFCQRLLSAPVEADPMMASILLRNIAMYDFQSFVEKVVPEMLGMDERFISVLMRTCGLILNPMHGFGEQMKRSSESASFDSNRQMLLGHVITLFISSKVDDKLSESNSAFAYRPMQDVIGAIVVPVQKAAMNNTTIPSNILHFAVHLRSYVNIVPLESKYRDLLRISEEACADRLKTWKTFFDIPHNAFGDWSEKLHLQIETSMEKRESWLIDALMMVPLMMMHQQDYRRYAKSILNIVVHGCVQTACAASLTYESLLIAFPGSCILFLNEVGKYCKTHFSLSEGRLHRVVRLYYHCIRIYIEMREKASRAVVDSAEFLVFCGLCSQHPETRMIAHDILLLVDELVRPSEDAATSLMECIKTQSSSIEQNVAASILREYSTSFVSTSPLLRISSISFVQAASCPYYLLWKFFMVALFGEMVQYPITGLLATLRTNFLEKLVKKVRAENVELNNIEVNKILFLVTISNTNLKRIDPAARKTWMSQIKTIDAVIASLVVSQYSTASFTFVFASVHLGSVVVVIDTFMSLITNGNVDFEKAIGAFASILRHVSMQTEFEHYIGQMVSSGLAGSIVNLYDRLLRQINPNSNMPLTCAISDFLVFRAVYCRHIYQTKLDKTRCAIPRCMRCVPVEDLLISPVLSKRSVFELLFRLSEGDHGIAHTARIALTYLAGLTSFYETAELFNTKFFNQCSVIAKNNPTFLRHILVNHSGLLIGPFAENALARPLGDAEKYMDALSGMFTPGVKKEELIYTQETFVVSGVGEDQSIPQVTEDDRMFIRIVHAEAGSILLTGLLFLMHSSARIRFSAFRLLSQAGPILSILKEKGVAAEAKELMRAIRKVVMVLPTHNATVLLNKVTELSSVYAKAFVHATKQVFTRAFAAIREIWQSREYCTRDQLLHLLTPWIRNVNFTFGNKLVEEQTILNYSCYSFISGLASCKDKLEMSEEFYSFWRYLVKNADPDLLALTIVDFATAHRDVQGFGIGMLLYVYRMIPKTFNFLIPQISYSHWYFHHVQLGKFEEISDMNEFLGCASAVNEGNDGMYDKYHESVDFALKALTAFVNEDVVPLIDGANFATIISFCLTHLHNPAAFELLRIYADVLKSSFNSGVPLCLQNICELLKRAASIPFGKLVFVTETTDSPLRALQNRHVSLSSLLGNFVTLLDYMPYSQNDLLSRCVLLWGIACGDLMISARALNLYASAFHATDQCVVLHVVNSACIVMRSWITSTCSPLSTRRVAEYVGASLRVMHSILADAHESGDDMRQYMMFFDLVVVIFTVKGPMLSTVATEALSLLTDLIRYGCYDSDSEIDTQNILIVAILTCSDAKVLVGFLVHIFDLPSTMLAYQGGYALYLIAFAPLFCATYESPQVVAEICELSEIRNAVVRIQEHFRSTHITALLTNIQNFSSQTFMFDLMETLKPFLDSSIIEVTALLLSSMINLAFAVKSDSLFDLGSALLFVNSTKKVVEGLVLLTREATLNQLSVISRSKVRFLQAISNYSHGVGFVDIPPELGIEHLSMQVESGGVLARLQCECASTTMYTSDAEFCHVKFETIDTFPPIFPFAEDLLKSPVVHEITNFCRRIQVDPQSGWGGTDTFNCKIVPTDDESLMIGGDAVAEQFSDIIGRIITEVLAEEQGYLCDDCAAPEQTDANESNEPVETDVYAVGTAENRTNVIRVSAFLPSPKLVDELLSLDTSHIFPVTVPKL